MNKSVDHRFSSFVNPSAKFMTKQITIPLTPDEAKKLEQYCEQTGKKVTDVIEELIHGLDTN